MKKFILILGLLFLVGFICVQCVASNKNEVEDICYSEVDDTLGLIDKLGIDMEDLHNDLYSEGDILNAYIFKLKVQKIFKEEDMNALGDIIEYPIYLTIGGQGKQINNKNELLNTDKKYIFNPEMKSKVENTKKLFINYQGFMFGDGEVWFQYYDNGKEYIQGDTSKFKIRAINN